MQPLGVPSPKHQPTSEFINNNHLIILDYVVFVPLKQGMGLKGTLQILSKEMIRGVIEARCFEQTFLLEHPLHVGDTSVGKACSTRPLINGVIFLFL